ncbi:MAG TPA: hypothetical protein ENK49_07880 [Gammaproteobacteria bacterium]|nr:hypothetical protein [Gammaproteobacteria bacterium]
MAGCNDATDTPPLTGKQLDPPAGQQTEARTPVDLTPEQQEAGKPAPASKKTNTHRPLDLSLPPQTAADGKVRNNTGTVEDHILPDLFGPARKPGDDSSVHLRGQVLMKPGAEQDFDSLEGGKVIIEMKTR